jgi:hypothetical protein
MTHLEAGYDKHRSDAIMLNTMVVKKCDSCQHVQYVRHKPQGEFHPLQIPERRWQLVSMDLITDLPVMKHGHDAIVTISCLGIYVNDVYAMTAHDSCMCTRQLYGLFQEIYTNICLKYQEYSILDINCTIGNPVKAIYASTPTNRWPN